MRRTTAAVLVVAMSLVASLVSAVATATPAAASGVTEVEQTGSSILTSGTSVTETFSSPTTAGDLLVAYATVYPYSSPVSAPPGFTAVGASAGPSGGGAYLWYKVANGGTSSYTFYQDPATSGEYSYFTVIEFSGTPANVAVDGSVAWKVDTTTSVSGYTQTYSSAPASSGEMAFAFFGTGSATSATASSGWTNISGPTNGTNNSASYFETTGATAPSITISSFSSTQTYVAGMVVLRSAPPTAWTSPALVDGGNTPESISCPSIASCQEVDNYGNALHWNGSEWSSPASVDGSGGLLAVSCPSVNLCWAVSGNGSAVEWNGTAWSSPVTIDGSDTLYGLSCPSVNLCWAVGYAGSAVEWNGTAWSSPVTIDGSNALFAISCPSTSLCWAVDSAGNALSWDGSTWSSPETIDTATIRSISCPSTTLCWAGDGTGNFLSWNGSVWSSPTSSGSNQAVNSLSCPTTTLCWAVDGAGDALSWNGSAWSALANIDPHPLFALSCPSTTLCWAMDDDGYALRLATPTLLGAASGPSYPTTTLTGSNLSVKATSTVGVLSSNWPSGWSIWLTTTDFTSGSHPPLDVVESTTAPTIACDGGSGTCTLASNSVTYPYTAPEAATAPAATDLLNAAAGTGIGNQTATFTWTATVPASAYAATYTSTWTYTIESAP